jgi:hypothetical protein
MEELRELDPSDDDKTLFTGYRGSGKTTELARLGEALRETHFVVPVNVEDQLNLGDVNYADLLVVLGLQVFQEAQASGVCLDPKMLDDLRFWYAEHVLEEDERRKLKSEVGGELNAVVAKVNVKLATDVPVREYVRREAQDNLSELFQRLNALLEHLAERSGKRTMVIVDGLDKMYDLKQVHDLFCQGANALIEPRCRIVYTVPLSLYHTNDFEQVRMSFHRCRALPNVKTHERDGAPCAEGRAALRRVLDRRTMPGLLTPEAADLLVDSSGGLLKELISLAREAALRARRLQGERGPVQVGDVEYAATQLRNTYRAMLTEEQYRELWKRHRDRRFVNSPVARELMYNLSLLEYNGGDAWWGVNPIVHRLLDERADELEEASGGKKTA